MASAASVHLENYVPEPSGGLRGAVARARVGADFVQAASRAVGDLDALLDLLAAQVTTVLGDACVVRLTAEDSGRLDLAALRARDPAAEAVANDVLRYANGDGTVLSAPMMVGPRTVGTVTAVRATPGAPYSDEDGRFLEELAGVAALAVENHRLSAARPRLERLAAAGQLAAGVAHDVSNVVTVVKLYAELLEAGSDLDSVGRDRLHAIRTQADRAVSLAWQVLDTAHRQPPDLVAVDIGPFVDEFAEVVRRILPAGVTLEVHLDGHVRAVRADPTRLQQMLTNLVSNAAHAVGGIGVAKIRVAPNAAGPGAIAGAWVRIDVADTGVGIAPDVLPHVFEPFFSTKPPGEGSGLGLAQVRALVADHGGHVAITSTPGEGTVVSLWLPAAGGGPLDEHGDHRDGQVGEGQRAAAPGRRGAGEAVLVVEDDPGLREALVDALASLGYRPDAVADGEEALAWLYIHGDGVCAVVTEMAMAGLGGEGLARHMAVAWPDIPVILTTSSPVSASGVPAGAPHVRLAKPFSVDQLAQALAAARP